MSNYTTRTSCRVCGNKNLTALFSLGSQYVSGYINEDQKSEDVGIRVPIDLELCNVCGLVQAKHTAPQELLYSRYYWYRSGVTQTMRNALRDVVNDARRIISLEPADVVLDIGSNDGTLLRNYPDWVKKVGVEPATNLAEQEKEGVDVFINDFWSSSVYDKHIHRNAKIITSIWMFYELWDPYQFIGVVAEVLVPSALFMGLLM